MAYGLHDLNSHLSNTRLTLFPSLLSGPVRVSNTTTDAYDWEFTFGDMGVDPKIP